MDDLEAIMNQLNDLKLEENPDNPEADLTEKLAGLSVEESPFGRNTQEVIKKIGSLEGVQNIVTCLSNSDLTGIPCKDLCILYTTEEEKLVLISLIGSCQLLQMKDAPLDKMIDWNLVNLLMNLIQNSEDPTVKVEITNSFSTLFKSNECALEMLLMEGFLPLVINNCFCNDEQLKTVSFQMLLNICKLNERYIEFMLQTGRFVSLIGILKRVPVDSDLQAQIIQFGRIVISSHDSFTAEEVNQLLEDLTNSLSIISKFNIQQNCIHGIESLISEGFENNILIKYQLKGYLETIKTNLDMDDPSQSNLCSTITNILSEIEEKEAEDDGSVQSGMLAKQEEVFRDHSDDVKIKYIRLLSLNIIDSKENIVELSPHLMVLVNNYSEFQGRILSMIVEAAYILLTRIPSETIIEIIKATSGDLGSFLIDNCSTFASNRRILVKLLVSLEKFCEVFSKASDDDQRVFDLYKEFATSIPQHVIDGVNPSEAENEMNSVFPKAKALLAHIKSEGC
ncbi:unnamed protein product [Moneuplotes crassus]|uniref:Uncharacterized protein n=2 Tax=Euplotes crassus TaxID=5936 RepID=A0AAD1UJF0_EUPCR|nr:unnamed protein product [Moneuplotes crassus]